MASLFIRFLMKTENEILVQAAKMCNISCIIEDDGGFFPVVDGRLANPLDPESYITVFRRNHRYRTSSAAELLDKVLCTCKHASKFRNAGFEVITYSTPGVPKVIKSEGVVHILGDYSKKNNLIYPIFCVQLSDSAYDQSKSKAWSVYKFTTPDKIDVVSEFDSHPVRGHLGADECSRTTYTLNADKYVNQNIITIHTRDEFTSRGCDTDYEVTFDIKEKPQPKKRKAIARKTTPDFVWQDKGDIR